MMRRRYLAGLLAVLMTAAPTVPVSAAPSETTVRGRYLTLTSIGDRDLMSSLQPGVPAWWEVGVAVDAPDPGTVQLTARFTGVLVDTDSGLRVAVRSCGVRWVDQECSTGESVALQSIAAHALADRTVTLGSMPSDEQRWLLVSVALDPDAQDVGGRSMTVTVGASGYSESVIVDGEGSSPTPGGGTDLPNTGAAVRGIVALAVVLLAGGWALVLAARRRRDDQTVAR